MLQQLEIDLYLIQKLSYNLMLLVRLWSFFFCICLGMMVAITTTTEQEQNHRFLTDLLMLMKRPYGTNFHKKAHRLNYLNCWVFVGIGCDSIPQT